MEEMIPLTNVLYVMDPELLHHSAIVNNTLVIVMEHVEVYYISMNVKYAEDQELNQEHVTVKETKKIVMVSVEEIVQVLMNVKFVGDQELEET